MICRLKLCFCTTSKPGTVISRSSWAMAKRFWDQFRGQFKIHSKEQGLYANCLIYKWARILLGPLAYCDRSHHSHKRNLSVEGWQIIIVEGWIQLETSYLAILLTSLTSLSLLKDNFKEYRILVFISPYSSSLAGMITEEMPDVFLIFVLLLVRIFLLQLVEDVFFIFIFLVQKR